MTVGPIAHATRKFVAPPVLGHQVETPDRTPPLFRKGFRLHWAAALFSLTLALGLCHAQGRQACSSRSLTRRGRGAALAALELAACATTRLTHSRALPAAPTDHKTPAPSSRGLSYESLPHLHSSTPEIRQRLAHYSEETGGPPQQNVARLSTLNPLLK